MVFCAVLLLSAQTSDFEPDVKKWTPEYESKIRQEMMDALQSFTSKYNTFWNETIFTPSEFDQIRVIDGSKKIISAVYRSSGYHFIHVQDKWRVKAYSANPGISPLSSGQPIRDEVELESRVRLEFGDYLESFGPTSSRYNDVRSVHTGRIVAGMTYTKPGQKNGELGILKVAYRIADGMLSHFTVDPYPEFALP